jgi:hypothetical protein
MCCIDAMPTDVERKASRLRIDQSVCEAQGMAQQVFTVSSSLSPAEAFARCIDLTRVNEWDRGVSNSTLLAGRGDEAGSQFEVTVTGFDGQPDQVVYELLDVDAPKRFVMEGVNAVFRAYDILTFTATDSGCTVLYDAQLDLVGDEPPLTNEQLDTLFARVAAVPEAGLQTFLNP